MTFLYYLKKSSPIIFFLIGTLSFFSQNDNLDSLKYRNIQEVEILSNKKIIEIKSGKTIFNLNNKLISRGESTTDILNYIPNVKIENNQLIISGKERVDITIDGIKQNISKENLISYINSIDPKDIKNIEIITIPPSNHDAEGNVGIISINMKKRIKDSWNINLQNSNIFGKYHTNNRNFSANMKKDKLFLSLSATYNSGVSQYINNNKYIYPQNEIWSNEMISKNHNNNFFSILGIEYKINDNLTLGANYNYSLDKNSYDDNSTTNIGGNKEYFLIESPAQRHSNTNLHKASIYSVYKNNDNEQIKLALNYIGFNKYNHNSSTTTFYPTENISTINSSGKQKTDSFSIAIDRTQSLNGLDLNYGGKVSFSDIENNESSSSISSFITDNYNLFRYKELTNASYISLNKTIGN